MMYVIIGDLHLMIYLKTICMKKIDMESPVSHIIYQNGLLIKIVCVLTKIIS